MRFVFCILIFSLTLKNAQAACTSLQTYKDNQVIEAAFDQAKSAKNNRDVSREIDYIFLYADKNRGHCGSLEELKIKPTQLYEFRIEGYKSGYKQALIATREAAKIGDVVEPTEYAKQYATALGLSKSQIESDISSNVGSLTQQAKGIAINRKQSCTNIDMNEKMGPLRDQKSSGWCFAVTAAEIASYHTGKRISAGDLAFRGQNWLQKTKSFALSDTTIQATDGGYPHICLESAVKSGFCSEDKFNLEKSEDFFKDLIEIEKARRATRKFSSQSNCARAISRLFPNVNWKHFQSIFAKAQDDNVVKLLANEACNPRIPVQPPIQEIVHTAPIIRNPDKLISELDQQLSQNVPVIAGIYQDYLTDGGFNSASGSKKHVVTIAGREFNSQTGQCEYIVRDSKGKSCDALEKPFDKKCKQGLLRVPEYMLRKFLLELTYIKK